MANEEMTTAQRPAPKWKEAAEAVWRWPRATQLFLIALCALYAPTLAESAHAWLHDEYQAHGVFIIPVSLFLLWLRREDLAQAKLRPAAWGLLLLALGLFVQMGSRLLQVQTQCFGIWSLVLALYGAILILHGPDLWQVVRFPVLFLMLAGGIPGKIILPLSLRLQMISSTGAVGLMKMIGLPVYQEGNVIGVPGHELEVADACSGLKKLVALFAFSLIYGYLFDISPARRLLLVAATVPIAILANILRVAGLIVVTYYGGERALHIAHDWAEIFVLVIAFLMFVGLGKVLGCKTLKYSL
jgi:exosortase